MSRRPRGLLGLLLGFGGAEPEAGDRLFAGPDAGATPVQAVAPVAAPAQPVTVEPVPVPAQRVPVPFPTTAPQWPATRLAGTPDVKIVVTGPFAAGKTTMVRGLASIEGEQAVHVDTETRVSDASSALKTFTTVSLDFASVVVPPPAGQSGTAATVRLFGTPGQDRYDFMWKVLAQGAQGLVVLMDASRRFSIEETASVLTYFRALMPDVPFVVGVGRWDGYGHPGALARTIGTDPDRVADELRPVDVRDPAQSLELLQHLLSRIDATARQSSGSAPTAPARHHVPANLAPARST